jgi:hypothetical protein
MSKYIHDGGSSFFTLLSKKLVRPFGFKKIRTSTGSFQTISASSRGKGFKFFGPLRTKSTGNLTKRMNYMNKRISGKTQKVEGYAFKLKESQMLSKSRLTNYKNQIHTQNTKIAELKGLQSMGKLKPKQLKELKKAESSVRSLQKTQKSIVKSYAKKSAKIHRKMRKAQTRLNYKVTKYAAKQKKYKGLMERKIYKSQKRLDKGFTKTCKNLKKTPGKSPMACLEAFEKCKASGHGLNLGGMTQCVNAESAKAGLPIDLKQGDITTTMTKLANKHFLRRFKRGRHLREISRITSGKGAKLQTSMNETAKTLQYGKTLAQAPTASGVGALSKARARQLTGQNIIPGNPKIKDFSSPSTGKEILNKDFETKLKTATNIGSTQRALTSEIAQLKSTGASPLQIADAEHRLSMSGQHGNFGQFASPEMRKYAENKAIKWAKRLDKIAPGFVTKKAKLFGMEKELDIFRAAQSAKKLEKAAAKAALPTKPSFFTHGPTALFKSKEVKAAEKAARNAEKAAVRIKHNLTVDAQRAVLAADPAKQARLAALEQTIANAKGLRTGSVV